jgi:hypothetical protein
MADGVISWKSVKQTLIVTSTIKVAFVFSFKATAHSVWLKSFIFEIRIMNSISRPLRIYYECHNLIFDLFILIILFTKKNDEKQVKIK